MVEMDNDKVEMIRGDPKKAINKLALPMIASMLLMSANNIIDSIWVAGLGSDPLAALGFVTPLFLIIVGIGNGLGAGANSLIARCIGERNHKKANNAGIHSIIISLAFTVVITVILAISLEAILILMGASDVLGYGMEYGMIIILGTFTFTIPGIFGGIFRAEGDVRRATIPLATTAIINIILDPILIYIVGWGIAGAALATVLSGVAGIIIFSYWTFIKKDTYTEIKRKYFSNDPSMYKEILVVGIPASVEQLIMSVTSIIINAMLANVAGVTAVAVYTAGWRLIQIGTMPTLGVGTAVITVAGVAYGARDYEKLKTTISYSIKVGLLTSIITAAFFFIFSYQLAYLFSYSTSSANLAPLISEFLRIMCLFIIPIPLGLTASSAFQAFGKGFIPLFLTANRSLILDVIFASIAAYIFVLGAIGIYWGMVLGDLLGSIVAYVAIKLYVKRMYNLGVFKEEAVEG